MLNLNPANNTNKFFLDQLCPQFRNIIVIEYQGVLLKMPSGKFSWGSVAAAKNALRNASHLIMSFENRRKLDWDEIYNMVTFKDLSQGNNVKKDS